MNRRTAFSRLKIAVGGRSRSHQGIRPVATNNMALGELCRTIIIGAVQTTNSIRWFRLPIAFVFLISEFLISISLVSIFLISIFLITGITSNLSAQSTPKLVADVGHADAIHQVVYSPDGSRILTASADRTAIVWDSSSGRQILELRGHSGTIYATAFSPDGQRIATSSGDDTIRVWDANTGEQQFRIHDLSDAVALAWLPDGNHLAAACEDDNAYIWDLRKQEIHKTLKGHTKDVVDIAVSPDGLTLATASWDGRVLLWSVATGEPLAEMKHPTTVESVAFSSAGTEILTGCNDGIARLWVVGRDHAGAEVKKFVGHEGSISAVAFLPKRDQIVTAGIDQTARIWDLGNRQEVVRLDGHPAPLESIASSPDGRRVITSAGDQLARIFSTKSGRELSRLGGLAGVDRLVFSRSGRLLATAGGGEEPTARVWELDDRTNVKIFKGHEDNILSVAISVDDTKMLTGSLDRTARLWDLSTGAELKRFEGHTYGVAAVAFSDDGKLAATAGGKDDSIIHLWDLESGEELQKWEAHSYGLTGLVFAPDGSRLNSVGWDHSCRIWQIPTGDKVFDLEHKAFVTCIAQTPDGKRIITGSTDHYVRIWDAQSGEMVRKMQGHTGDVYSVACSGDGKLLLSGGEHLAIVWDLEAGRDLGNLQRSTAEFGDVSVFTNSEIAVTTGLDRIVHLWNVKTRKHLCRLISFQDGQWAVIDEEGRFDASNAGDIDHLHWMIGAERVALDQLKQRYYDPGLLAKYLGSNDEPPRNVSQLRAPKLYPVIEATNLADDAPRFDVKLTDQGGGIGRVVVWLNGKEILPDARPKNEPSARNRLAIQLDLTNHPFLIPGGQNRVEVRAYNAEGYLASRGLTREFVGPGEATDLSITLWAVVVGVSDYSGDQLDLRYAAKDAEDFHAALEVAAHRLFGVQHTKIKLLTTSAVSAADHPNRENILRTFESFRSAKPTDVVVVYFAGHGVNFGGQDGDYYFLTNGAASAELTDPEVRRQTAISSKELSSRLNKIPANKQVLILDTCAAGSFIDRLSVQRAVPSSQVRALERVKDRSGVHVLAGCAADRVSYETSRYGQGLLTYSLLLGMRGGRLRDDEYVDVVSLFGFAADEVPKLAKDIGGVQRPQTASPSAGSSFDIGRVLQEDVAKIPFRLPKPLVVRASFSEKFEFLDVLNLTKRVNEQLRETQSRGSTADLVFVDAVEVPSGFRLVGQYEVNGPKVDVTAILFQDRERKAQFQVRGDSDQPDLLAKQIVSELQQHLVPHASPPGPNE